MAPEESTRDAAAAPAAKVGGNGPSTVSSARPAVRARSSRIRCRCCQDPRGPPRCTRCPWPWPIRCSARVPNAAAVSAITDVTPPTCRSTSTAGRIRQASRTRRSLPSGAATMTPSTCRASRPKAVTCRASSSGLAAIVTCSWWPSAQRCAPTTIGVKNWFSRFGTTTATRPVRPFANPLAARLSTKSSDRAACCTRTRVAGATSSGRLNARDAVDVETPASPATSDSVATAFPSVQRGPAHRDAQPKPDPPRQPSGAIGPRFTCS